MVKLNINNYFETIKAQLDLQKPDALPWGEWETWHASTKSSRPFVYFLMETLPTKSQDVWRFFTKPFTDLRYAIRVRIFDKYHIIKTGLPPGYIDGDTRIMHGLFNLLIDFVEVERALMYVIFSAEAQQRHKHPWWSVGRTRFKAFRDPAAGLAHLKWEMTLDSPSLPAHEQSPSQAASAREIWEMYHWWKFARPARPDPNDASGWSEHCDLLRARGHNLFNTSDETPEERRRSRECLDRSREIQEIYDAEDDQMLIRLIKIRKSLWT